jgi:hypothetical protein
VERIATSVERLAVHLAFGRPGRVPGTRELVVNGTPYLVPYRVRAIRLRLLGAKMRRDQRFAVPRCWLLELSSEFGIEESRGTLLRVAFSHKDIAELVGASRPRVTEHMAQLERDRFVVRDGRRLFVQVLNSRIR